MKLHPVEIVAREWHGDHLHIQYRWPGTPPEPGQFVMVRPADTALDPFLARPFFVHDYYAGTMSLLVVVRGRATRRLAETESALLVSEPGGQGFQLLNNGPVALIGGGVWVSPLKFLSGSLRQRGIPHDIFLEAPRGSSGDYLHFLSESFPEAVVVESADDAERLISYVGDLSRYEALYVSGTSGTLAAVKSAAAGVVPAQLAVRERMACANGSCYGCAVLVWRASERTFVRACVEGPVFEAKSLAW